MHNKLAILAAALGAAVLIFWAATGMHAATRTQIPEVVVSEDAFGDQVEETKWRDGFELGLLDGAAPAAGGLFGAAALLFWLGRRKASRA
jgi:hypothetical protein